jgi:hypothetical protein
MKKVIRATESDLTTIVKMIINESYHSTKKSLVVTRNNKALGNIKNQYLSDTSINKTVVNIINKNLYKFVKEVNSKSGEIANQIISGKGSDSATIYLQTLKDVIYSTVNDMNWAKKKLISTLVSNLASKDEFNNIIKNFDTIINDVYDRLITDVFLYVHDPTKSKEAEWYEQAWNVANNRKESIKKHLVDWIKSQIFG